MKTWQYASVIVALLSSCIQQSMPDWDDLPGENCSLVTFRLLSARADAALLTEQGKKVTLRESEKARLRDYLRLFTEEAQATVVTYAPRTVLYGEDFSLNFQTDTVILSIGKGNRNQFARPIGEADKEILQLLRKRSDSRVLKR